MIIYKYAFDELNRLQTVTAPDGGVTSYTYDNVGNRKTVTYPNGTVATYAYDALNRLTNLENKTSVGDVISSYAYTLGPAGNRTRVVEYSGRTVDYTYDNLNRLVEEAIVDSALGNEIISYTYDAFGNRLTKTDATGTTDYMYNANDQLTTDAGPMLTNTYVYDDNGNMISKSDGIDTTDYYFDYENRLVSVQTLTYLAEYSYDVDGIRVQSILDGVGTNFLVDKNRSYAQVLEERDDASSLTVHYVYGDDLISQHRSGVASYYHYDGQMSTRQLTDSSGVISDSYVYDAFGVLLDQSGSTENNYLYTGEQFDPNAGFYYLRARYYDQGLGRFVGVDPWEGNVAEPITLHRYLYANVNPVMNIDPTGEFTLVGTMASVSLRKSLSVVAITTVAAVVAFEPPIRLYRYTSVVKVEQAKSTDRIVGDYGVTWWTDVFYVKPEHARTYLSLKYPPDAWLSVLVYRIKDWIFGPREVEAQDAWGTIGTGREYWTFKPIPFWSRSPSWGYY